MAVIIQLRRDTAANWTSANPILAQGELAVETDTKKFKIGDGINVWSVLPYFTQGAAGSSATVAVGTTTTGAAGTSASVSNSGTSSAAVLNFTIPQGAKGDQGDPGDPGAPGDPGTPGTAATVSVGTTTTGAAGSSASVTNSGTTSAAVFNFTIPKGDKGNTGDPGSPGTPGAAATIAVGTTTTGAAGSSATVANSGTSSAAVFDFTIPKGDTGATGTAATVAVGTTTTGAAGSSATVSNSGTSSAAVLNFTIPKGDTGSTGPTGAGVPTGGTTNQLLSKIDGTNYNTQWIDAPAATNGIPTGGTSGQIIVKNSSTNYDASWVDNTAPNLETYVKNATGTTLNKGSVVYITGADSATNNVQISLADADAEATSSKTFGFLKQTLTTGSFGYVVNEGVLDGVDTSGASAGDSVWLSGTAGGYVFGAPPAKPAHSVYLGVVSRVHASQGRIQVKVQNGYEVEELHNANIGSVTSLTSGDLFKWNGTYWINSPQSTLSITKSQVSDFPTLGTASAKDIPATGDASSTQVVYGTDTRLTNSRTPSGSAGGDLTGTYPNPTLAAVGTAGTYGSATQVPVITTDSKGRVTSVTNTTITASGGTSGYSYASGKYYETQVGTNISTLGLGQANRMYFYPFIVGKTFTLANMSISLTSTNAGSIRLGIYSDSAGVPSTLVVDAGTVSATTAGTKTISGIATSLSSGVYWLAVWVSANTNGNTPSYQASSSSYPTPSVLVGQSALFNGFGNIPIGYYLSATFSTFASSFSTYGTSWTEIYNIPRIMIGA